MEGIAKCVAAATGLKVTVADDPELCAVLGAGKAIERITEPRIYVPGLPALPVKTSADF